MCRSQPPNWSITLLSPSWCPYVCSLHLYLCFCFANKIIYTVFLDSTYLLTFIPANPEPQTPAFTRKKLVKEGERGGRGWGRKRELLIEVSPDKSTRASAEFQLLWHQWLKESWLRGWQKWAETQSHPVQSPALQISELRSGEKWLGQGLMADPKDGYCVV